MIEKKNQEYKKPGAKNLPNRKEKLEEENLELGRVTGEKISQPKKEQERKIGGRNK